jgi:hypothetical protein
MNDWTKIKKRKALGRVPHEASENIKAPELAPRDKRFTGRTKKIGFTCFPQFYQELRKLAFVENCKQIEVLERALEAYKKQKKRCAQCWRLLSEEERSNCDGCDEEFCEECLTYQGDNEELAFCKTCEGE